MESTIELSVFKKEIHFIKKDILTTGQQRNSMKITFNGKEWDKLTKFGVFKVENVVRYVLITSSDISCIIRTRAGSLLPARLILILFFISEH